MRIEVYLSRANTTPASWPAEVLPMLSGALRQILGSSEPAPSSDGSRWFRHLPWLPQPIQDMGCPQRNWHPKGCQTQNQARRKGGERRATATAWGPGTWMTWHPRTSAVNQSPFRELHHLNCLNVCSTTPTCKLHFHSRRPD